MTFQDLAEMFSRELADAEAVEKAIEDELRRGYRTIRQAGEPFFVSGLTDWIPVREPK